jgi:hypothetical protein
MARVLTHKINDIITLEILKLLGRERRSESFHARGILVCNNSSCISHLAPHSSHIGMVVTLVFNVTQERRHLLGSRTIFEDDNEF